MSLTRVTDNVVTQGTIAPGKLSTGAPVWNSSGVLSATGFIGDGSNLLGVGISATNDLINQALTANYIDGYITAQGFVGDGSGLTNIFPAASVIEITTSNFLVEPKHNNCTVILNSLSTIIINVDLFNINFKPGHITSFVQYNTGRGQFASGVIRSANDFFETKKQYAVCNLLNFEVFGWTLYGDLTSTALTSAPVPTIPISGFTQIIAPNGINNYFSLALSGDQVYSTGGPVFYDGTFANLYKSVFTKLSGSWAKVSANENTIVALSGGLPGPYDLYVLGSNLYGDLGLNYTSLTQGNVSLFTKVPGKWTDVVCGINTTYAFSGDKLFSSGRPAGLFNDNRSTFTQVPGSWTTAVGGPDFTCLLSGTDLYTCGHNPYGALGTNDNVNKTTLTKIPGKWSKIVPGYYSSYALSAGTDKFFATGYNEYGNLGLGDIVNRSTYTQLPSAWNDISAGYLSLIALSGTDLYVVGNNVYGQAGLGDTVLRSTFTKVAGSWTTAAAGSWKILALSGNKLFTTGYNFIGQLGTQDTLNRLTFTQITGVAI